MYKDLALSALVSSRDIALSWHILKNHSRSDSVSVDVRFISWHSALITADPVVLNTNKTWAVVKSSQRLGKEYLTVTDHEKVVSHLRWRNSALVVDHLESIRWCVFADWRVVIVLGSTRVERCQNRNRRNSFCATLVHCIAQGGVVVSRVSSRVVEVSEAKTTFFAGIVKLQVVQTLDCVTECQRDAASYIHRIHQSS
jgi:hypothetical protein